MCRLIPYREFESLSLRHNKRAPERVSFCYGGAGGRCERSLAEQGESSHSPPEDRRACTAGAGRANLQAAGLNTSLGFIKGTRKGAYHKAGFTCRKSKGVRTFLFVLLFALLALQGIVCYTFWGVLLGDNIAFLREEGGTRSVTEGARATLDSH